MTKRSSILCATESRGHKLDVVLFADFVYTNGPMAPGKFDATFRDDGPPWSSRSLTAMGACMRQTIYRFVVGSSLFAIVACGGSSQPLMAGAPQRSAVAIGVSGGHLVDASGFTLYETPNACTGSCLTAWPPFNASQVPAATTGASQPAIALSAGEVTYNGHLLYYFNTDGIPGQINGSGVNGFSLVSP